MTDYTPTTREVKEWYADSIDRLGGGAEFDRWHANEMRKAKAKAWEEGITASGINLDWQLHLLDHNPYTKEQS